MPTINDLTNTKWLLNSTFTEMPNGHIFDADDGNVCEKIVLFTSNNASFNCIYYQDADYNFPGISYMATSAYTDVWGAWNGSSWINEAYRTIKITGGRDATDAEFIAWLQQNATFIEEEQSSSLNNLSLGSLNISKMFIGNNDVSKIYYGSTLVYEKGSGSSSSSSGYSGNITGTSIFTGSGSGDACIKFDTAPSSNNDYDARILGSQNATLEGVSSYSNKTILYAWGGGNITIGETQYSLWNTSGYIHTYYTYNNPLEIELTENADISLLAPYNSNGSN